MNGMSVEGDGARTARVTFCRFLARMRTQDRVRVVPEHNAVRDGRVVVASVNGTRLVRVLAATARD